MATQITPFLHLTEAIPGSNEPFSTAVVNGNFDAIDAFASNANARVSSLETWQTTTTPNLASGLIPSGTAAARDIYWGIPATALDRVTLANKAPRWFNTDKGYQERYFAPTSDSATAGYSTLFARVVGGWLPEGIGLIPVNWNTPTTLTGTTGFKADINGNTLVLTGITQAAFTNLFTNDFTCYELHYNLSAPAVTSPLLRVATAGTPDAGAAAYVNEWLSGSSAVAAAATATTNAARLYKDASSQGWVGKVRIWDPMDAAKVTQFTGESHRANAITIVNSVHNTVGARDGIAIVQEAATFLTGYVQLYGLAGGHV